jgi:16S rRNA (cytosine967-C5)-methyltransferase
VGGAGHTAGRVAENVRMNEDKGARPRAIAARVLDAVLHRGRSLKAELAQALPALADVRDRALVEAICFAALRQQARADAALRAWVPRPLGKRDGELRALLHAGFAQLDPLGLAPHAAVDATVGAARVLGRAHQRGMVNALLRRAQREGLPAAPADAAWPAWLRERLRADWPDEYAAIVAASASPAPMWLRVNRLHGSRDDYAARLREAGIEATGDDALPDALRLDAPVAVAALPGFDSGDVSVQDGAAQAVADALPTPPGAPASGRRLLDACAAPGGKAAHLLERDPSLRLTALDVDPRRLERVRETLARLGIGADATLHVADAAALDTADPGAWWDGVPFDAVLLDAPCSATGIVRRQPDVLLHRRAADLDALTALQARLLDAAWRVLSPGGVLLYATCSILHAENAGQVEAFLARTADAVAEPLDHRFGRVSGAGRQRLPGDRGMDGFFYARLRRH